MQDGSDGKVSSAPVILNDRTPQQFKGVDAILPNEVQTMEVTVDPAYKEPAPDAVWFPKTVKVVGTDVPIRNVIIVCGASGSGKTHLGHQLMQDPDYGPEEVYFLMKEDGTSTYGLEARFDTVNTFQDATDRIAVMLEAAKQGHRLPKILFMDSISGLADGTQEYYYHKPIESFSENKNMMVRDKRAEFGELGAQFLQMMRKAGNPDLPMTVIANMTTYKDPKKLGSKPELAVEGNMVPKHLSRVSTVTLFLQPEARVLTVAQVNEFAKAGTLVAPHRFIGEYDPKGDPEAEVTIINRFFYTQDTGEVLAKGHRNLKLKEPANLPDILRRINFRQGA